MSSFSTAAVFETAWKSAGAGAWTRGGTFSKFTGSTLLGRGLRVRTELMIRGVVADLAKQ